MNFFEIVGYLLIAYVSYVLLSLLWNLVYTCFLGKILGRTLDVRKLGSWAVVTGATDGIGRCYAEELARKGLNIVLISRSLPKLQNVAKEIESKFVVKTQVIDVDFTKGPEIYDRIGQQLQDLDIGVLINNVGMSYPHPEFLAYVENGSKFCVDLMNCNILSVTGMTMLVLPKMVEKRQGFILNVASASALMPTALLTMYASTKAFVHKFSQDLAVECRDQGVTVQCVLPGFVATNMSRIRKATITAPTPQQFVRGHMNTFGLEVSSPGYWVHKIQFGVYQLVLTLARPLVERMSLVGMLSLRARNLCKKAQTKTKDEPAQCINPLAEKVLGSENAEF